MENKQNYFEHFELQYTPSSVLNALFSANYTLLRILNEQKPFGSPEDKQMFFGRDDLWGKEQKMYDYWLEGKVEAYAELRNNLFKESRGHIPTKEAAGALFARNSARFIAEYNRVYGTNKKFSEVFDRRYIIDRTLANDLAKKGDPNANYSQDKINLFVMYDELLSFLTDYYAVEAAREVAEALEDDLTQYGYRSLYYNKPSNENVMKFDWNTFVEISHFVADAYDNSIAALKEMNKAMENLSKRMAKNPGLPEYAQEQAQLMQDYGMMYTEAFISEHLLDYLDEIETRFQSANKTYEGFSTKIRDKIFNFLSNQTTQPRAKELDLDTVYMHRHELSDVFDMVAGLIGGDKLYKDLIAKYPRCERRTPDLFVEKTEQ
jgi:hypothetical protein